MSKSKKKKAEGKYEEYIPPADLDLSMFPIKYAQHVEEICAKTYGGYILSRTGDTCVFKFWSKDDADNFQITFNDVVGFTANKISNLEVETGRTGANRNETSI